MAPEFSSIDSYSLSQKNFLSLIRPAVNNIFIICDPLRIKLFSERSLQTYLPTTKLLCSSLEIESTVNYFLHATKTKTHMNELTHFQLMSYFYIPWKHPKTSGFQMFSGGVEMENCLKIG